MGFGFWDKILCARDEDKAWSLHDVHEKMFRYPPSDVNTVLSATTMAINSLKIKEILTKLESEGKIEAREVQMPDGSLTIFYASKYKSVPYTVSSEKKNDSD